MTHTSARPHDRAPVRRRARRVLGAAALTLVLAGCGLIGGDDKPKPANSPTGSTEAKADPSGRVKAADIKPDVWEDGETPPGSFESSGTAIFDGKLWVAGGFNQDRGVVADVWVFDPEDESWDEGPKLPFPLTHASLAEDGNRLLLIGGYRGENYKTALDTVYRLNKAQDKWERGPKLPVKLGAAAAAWDGDRVVLAGGVRGDGEPSDAVYVLEGTKWEELDDTLSQAREHLAADSDGQGKVWFIAGEETVDGEKTEFGTVDLVDGDKVEEFGELPIARGAVGGFWLPPATVCGAGGRNTKAEPSAAVDCVDGDGEQFSLPSLPEPRFGGATAVFGDKLYVFGGLTPGAVASDLASVLPLTGG